MKVGDLVKETRFGLDRTGIVVEEITPGTTRRSRLFKVLWNKRSPTLPTLIGPAWQSEVELVNESR